MTEVAWKDDYCIGNEVIDSQHKKLFDILNQLYIASEQGREIEDVLELFDELDRYTKYHFEEEEKFFSTLSSVEMEAHQEMHQFFINELAKTVQQSLRIGSLSLGLIYFLTDWLVYHIQVEDRKYLPE